MLYYKKTQAIEENMRIKDAIGAMQLWEYRAKWYAEPEETAKAMVQMDDRDVIE